MKLTIELPPEQEALLREIAAQRGQTPEAFALDLLKEILRESEHEGEAAAATTDAATTEIPTDDDHE